MSYAARLAAGKISDLNIVELENCIMNMIKLHESNSKENYPKIVKNNSKFHQIISEASEHKRINFYIKKNNALSMLSRANEFYLFNRGSDYMDEHIAIFNAIKSRDSVSAEECVKVHIKNDLRFYKLKFEELFRKMT